MVTREELEEYKEANRRATDIADKAGKRPHISAPIMAIITAVGVFFPLDVFAATTLPARNEAFWPVVILLTLICSGTAGGIQQRREKAWHVRWSAAFWESAREHLRGGR
jgi:predicted membrane protein